MASIRDVAEKAGVSPATVSRAFTTPDLISVPTQKRVFEAARSLEYSPARSRVSRQIAVGRTDNGLRTAPTTGNIAVRNAIGFQYFSATSSPGDTAMHNTFYAPLLSGAQSEASALGLHLLVHTTDRHTLSQELPRMIVERVVGGVLLVGTADPSVLSTFSSYVDSIVLVDNHDRDGAFESVVSDGFGGAHAATRHLIEMGHRHLCFLMDDMTAPSFQDRLRGFLCAQIEVGITPDPVNLILDGNRDVCLTKLTALLKAPVAARPTALLAANDENAFHALRLCRDLSIGVPEDLSVIGFDDTVFSRHAEPPLTTVRVDKEYMGRLAVRRLYARMLRQADLVGQTVGTPIEPVVSSQVGVSLEVRRSCAPPARA